LDIGHWTLVIGRWSLAIGILLLPGYFTLHLPIWGKTNSARTTFGPRLFLSLLIGVLICGLIGLVLAQAGVFSLGGLLLALAAYSVFCLALIVARRVSGLRSFGYPFDSAQGKAQDKFSIAGFLNRKSAIGIGNRKFAARRPSPIAGIRLGWEDAIVISLFCLSLLLYARPAEYILGWLDAGWYVNTGVHIAKTGSLSGENQIFASLPPAAKPLFYNSFAALRETFSCFPDTESRGIFLWAFALADPDKGELTAYHAPLFSVWIAIFYVLGGLRFSLYATPFFGALSVLSLYFAGKAMFGRKVGLLAAVLLTISFTQTYFSRMPYSEILNQCLLFSGIYALTTYIAEHKPLYAAIAALSFGQAILSRIEALIVILPLAMFFGCWMILKRNLPKDFRFFAIPFGLLLVDEVVLALTVSRPYVELNSYGLWVRIRPLLTQSPALLVISVVSWGGLLVLVMYWGLSESANQRISESASQRIFAHSPTRSFAGKEGNPNRVYEGRNLITTLLSLAILLLAVYAYFISKSETLVQLGQFMSPWGLWLGLFGLVELVRRGVNEKTAFFLALVLIHGLATLSVLAISTTRSYVYPIRRQATVLIPSLILLASYGILIWNKEERRGFGNSLRVTLNPLNLLRVAQLIAIAILLVGFLALNMPYVNHRDMPDTIAFSQKLASHFSERDVVIFEEIWAQDSRVGYFAAPLWSIYDKDTLLISTVNPEEEAFSTAIAHWLDGGKRVYFVSQSDLPLFSLEEYQLRPIAEEMWRYSTITAKLVFPPEIKEFEIPFHIYQIAEGESL
jgi:4-amino-4-deoxy-L-arabinose transferase-like glycosyltransferase